MCLPNGPVLLCPAQNSHVLDEWNVDSRSYEALHGIFPPESKSVCVGTGIRVLWRRFFGLLMKKSRLRGSVTHRVGVAICVKVDNRTFCSEGVQIMGKVTSIQAERREAV